MCGTCGCNITEGNKHLIETGGVLQAGGTLDVLKTLLEQNDHTAAHNRQHFDQHQVLAINIMSSPGSGKTALLEATIKRLSSEYKIAVIEGDLETENDAKRIRKHGVPAIQIETGTACHLDAHLIHNALHQLNLDELDIVFIENVGNLVCPASFDLGQHFNVTLLSTTEGHDKPEKYPVIFRAADLMLITKLDLLEILDDFDPGYAINCLRRLANPAPVISLSAKTAKGIDEWSQWVIEKMKFQTDGLQINVSKTNVSKGNVDEGESSKILAG